MKLEYLYKTPEPFDDLFIASDGDFLKEITFCQDENPDAEWIENAADLPAVLLETKKWLDLYFSGEIPDFMPKYKMDKMSDFRKEVIAELEKIPYGKSVSYGNIAEKIASRRGIPKMSAQAVGQAVGSNPICIILPCHRVIASNGALTGYHGGIHNKKALLDLENTCNVNR